MTLKRGQVIVRFDDGTEYTAQGQVLVRESKTTSDIEYHDGRRKSYPLLTSEIRVIIKDEAHEVLDRRFNIR